MATQFSSMDGYALDDTGVISEYDIRYSGIDGAVLDATGIINEHDIRFTSVDGYALDYTGHIPEHIYTTAPLNGYVLDATGVLADTINVSSGMEGYVLDATGVSNFEFNSFNRLEGFILDVDPTKPRFNVGDTFESLLRTYLNQTSGYLKLVSFDALTMSEPVGLSTEQAIVYGDGINTTLRLIPNRTAVLGRSFEVGYCRYPIATANIKGARYHDIQPYLNRPANMHEILTRLLGVEIKARDFAGYQVDENNRTFTITVTEQSYLWEPGSQLVLS